MSQNACCREREHRAMLISDGKKGGELWKSGSIVYRLMELLKILFQLKIKGIYIEILFQFIKGEEEKPSPQLFLH